MLLVRAGYRPAPSPLADAATVAGAICAVLDALVLPLPGRTARIAMQREEMAVAVVATRVSLVSRDWPAACGYIAKLPDQAEHDLGARLPGEWDERGRGCTG